MEETASAGLAEEGAEHQNPRLSGNRRAAQVVNVGQRFIRPAAPPPPNPPKVDTGENTTRAAEESMGKLASASRSSDSYRAYIRRFHEMQISSSNVKIS